VYCTPPTKLPVTVNGLDVPETDKAIEGLLVAVYPVIGEPPLLPAVNGIETVVLFVLVTVPIVGACGTDENVTAEEALDAVDVPLALVAVIVNVYACPDANDPVTVSGEVTPLVESAIEGLEATV
jgi:hypothetical protein